MKIIKLDATESTNHYLKELVAKNTFEDFTVVTCEYQKKGKGQRGNSWISERGKNLTVSVLKHFSGFDMAKIFYLNLAVSLAILHALKGLAVPGLKVKWPNDIMSGNKKICGILVETVLKGGQLKYGILGFGLNVNQIEFENLTQAASLKHITGKHYDLDRVLELVLSQLQLYLENIDEHVDKLHLEYESALFNKDTPSMFIRSGTNQRFKGTIDGISPEGKLLVVHEDGTQLSFYNKEVQLIY